MTPKQEQEARRLLRLFEVYLSEEVGAGGGREVRHDLRDVHKLLVRLKPVYDPLEAAFYRAKANTR